MTTRRDLLIIAGGATLLGGCRDEARAAVAVPDAVVAGTGQGLVVLGGPHPRGLGREAVSSPDGAVLASVSRGEAGRSHLVRLDPAAGDLGRPLPLDAGWFPRVLAADGGFCALTTSADPRPVARDRTPLLVLSGAGPRVYDLPGVVEPDAFTRDGTGLFVLEWLPPRAPDSYRVRRLDLATGRLEALLTRDKVAVPAGAEEEMRGEGRQAVLSPDRQLLYTLYTHQPGHQHTRDLIAGRAGGAHAFVHVLHLVEGWAYCLDLPEPFGRGPAAGHALAVSTDGLRLAVADVLSGCVAYADTTALTVDRVVTAATGAGAASLAFTPDGRRLLLGAGRSVTVLGAVIGSWPVPAEVRGLGVSRDGARVYVGGAGEVLWLDAATGAVRGRAPVAGLTEVRHVR